MVSMMCEARELFMPLSPLRLRGGGCCPSKQSAGGAVVTHAESPPAVDLLSDHAGGAVVTHAESPPAVDLLATLAATASKQRAKDTLLDERELAGSWTKHEGAELEVLLAADSMLGDSPVALIDARFLVALAKAGGLLRRRQDLPPEAFITLEHLKRMPIGWGSLRLICVSHPWLQPDTPDPKGSTLAILTRVLDSFLNFTGNGTCTWAVFIEYVTGASNSRL